MGIRSSTETSSAVKALGRAAQVSQDRREHTWLSPADRKGPLGKEETDSACPSIKRGAALGQLGPGGVTCPRSSPTRGQGP